MPPVDIASEVAATESDATVAAVAAERAENAADNAAMAASMQIAQVTHAAAGEISAAVQKVDEIKEDEKWLREKILMLETTQAAMSDQSAALLSQVAELTLKLEELKSPIPPTLPAPALEVPIPAVVTTAEAPKEGADGLPVAGNQSSKKRHRYL